MNHINLSNLLDITHQRMHKQTVLLELQTRS